MAKEKADTFNAIAVAAQGEWNRMQGLKFARPTRILEEHQGAEVGRYYLCHCRSPPTLGISQAGGYVQGGWESVLK